MPFSKEDFDRECCTSGCSRMKKKHRRRKCKKRPMKSYYTLSLKERDEAEKQEAKNVNKFSHGQPLAPYNSTSFLMDEHGKEEKIMNEDENQSKGPLTEDYIDQQFSMIYDQMNLERLNNLSKDKLIEEFLFIERKYNITKTALEKSMCIDCSTKCDYIIRCMALENLRLEKEVEELKKGPPENQ